MKFRKIEKELEQRIQNSNYVSGNVLNRARIEMQNKESIVKPTSIIQPKSRGLLRFVMPAFAFIFLFTTICFLGVTKKIYAGNSFQPILYMEKFTKTKSDQSIEEINQENNKEMIYIVDATVLDTYIYTLDNNSEFFYVVEENYLYKDILLHFSALPRKYLIKYEPQYNYNYSFLSNGIKVYYFIEESKIGGKIHFNQYNYYFEFEDCTDIEFLKDFVSIYFKN